MALITISDKNTGDTLTAAEFNQILDALKDGTRDINALTLQIAGSTKYFPQTGNGSPATTPNMVGELYVDTTNGLAYIAKGTGSSADWKEIFISG